KLTTRDDPHEGLFAAYDEAIGEMRSLSRTVPPAAQRDIEPVLRRFELRLLQELGYAVELAREAGSHAPIAAEREYLYVVERGAVPAQVGETPSNAVRLAGQTLIDLERGDFASATTASQSKQLMRLLIHHSLNGQELATRSLVRDLQRIEGEEGAR
ncbi:MAG TPA: DNA repair protein RecO C-terminal domain-containing protein, partial [Usitatibacter sp.]|nr:DNA repair protein RecO C-terminal domain-containing protein [Usitatibacter sp.]